MQWKILTSVCRSAATCFLLICGPPTLRSQSATPAEVQQKKAETAHPVKNASAEEIQAAKSSGKVWVNTESGVYHKGGKWFGNTKQGKFMTEQDAVKAGYRPAKNEK
jgi:hypothetical protein